MPRGRVSEADLLLIGECASQGVRLSPYQLERWRRAGALPKPVRRGLGQGRGSTSAYPPGALETALRLGRAAAQGRSLHATVLEAFYMEAEVPTRALRAALAWQQRRARAHWDRVRRGGEDAEEAEVRSMVRLVEGWRRSTNPDVGKRYLPQARLKARRDQLDALKTSASHIVLARLYDDVEAWGARGVGEFMRGLGMGALSDEAEAYLRSLERRGEAIWTEYPKRGMTPLSDANLAHMPAARTTFALWGIATTLLRFAGAAGDENAAAAWQFVVEDHEYFWIKWTGPPLPGRHLLMVPLILAAAADPERLLGAWRVAGGCCGLPTGRSATWLWSSTVPTLSPSLSWSTRSHRKTFRPRLRTASCCRDMSGRPWRSRLESKCLPRSPSVTTRKLVGRRSRSLIRSHELAACVEPN